jgi:hypothetical protein
MTDKNRRRYGDNDKHFGPFTFCRHDKHWTIKGIELNSGGQDDDEDDGRNGCHLLLHTAWWTLILELPRIVRPKRKWVDCSKWNGAGSGYWAENGRVYGFTVSDGYLSVKYGVQTNDSSTDQSWGWLLPWTQWRFVRHSLYGLLGEHVWTELEKGAKRGIDRYEARRAAEDAVPKALFSIIDFDGQKITATTHIEEREWRFGEGWFKWLSLFRRPKIRRSLSISFDKEVGKSKGSWKGGMVGTSIDMLRGELHEAAFRRFCAEEHRSKEGRYRVTFAGPISPMPAPVTA